MTEIQTDGPTDGQIADGQTDKRADGQTDGNVFFILGTEPQKFDNFFTSNIILTVNRINYFFFFFIYPFITHKNL